MLSTAALHLDGDELVLPGVSGAEHVTEGAGADLLQELELVEAYRPLFEPVRQSNSSISAQRLGAGLECRACPVQELTRHARTTAGRFDRPRGQSAQVGNQLILYHERFKGGVAMAAVVEVGCDLLQLDSREPTWSS